MTYSVTLKIAHFSVRSLFLKLTLISKAFVFGFALALCKIETT